MEITNKVKILITIIVSFIILLLGANYSQATEYPLSRFDTRWGYNISWAYTLSADNIYCLEEGDGWPRDTNRLECWWRIEINDGVARLYGGASDKKVKKTYEGQLDEKYGVVDNDLMASILYFGDGYGVGGKSSAQKAVYAYMNRWLERAGMKDWSQRRYASGSSDYGVSNRFVDYADKFSCNVTMYFLVNKKSNRQNLLVIERNGKEQRNIDIPVEKVWNDQDNKYNLRTESITVKLLESGNDTGKTLVLNSENNWKGTFEELDPKGNYTIEEVENTGYITTITGSATKGFKITNELITYDGYIEISGKVWIDKPDGKGNDIDGKYSNSSDSKDEVKEGIPVRLKYIDENGNHQLFNKDLPNLYETKTDSNGEYKIVVNYDNSQKVYKLFEDIDTINKKMETAYVEFEYDGMTYTTVATAQTGADTSKATENENMRNEFDGKHSTVTAATTYPDEWTDKIITASTNKVASYERGEAELKYLDVEYCNGDGSYIITNPYGAWKEILQGTRNLACDSGQEHSLRTFEITVEKIPNINLGLFEREQPDVAIFSDLTKVEVEMNKQKYTYLYGVRGSEKNDVGLKAKFQNKDTYTYKRPVNPADIAYIQEESNKNAMSVVVTYEVKVANLSTTLQTTINEISNYFDKQYTLNTEGWTVDTNGAQFNKATKGDLNITLQPQKTSTIELKYTVSPDAIRGLLNEEATLNNAVEIESYSTMYGGNTLYAEQRTGERTGKPYAGYDYNSQPGNAGMFINEEGRLEATKLEDDTDIAPSFVLCKDDTPKTLAGTVWEDKDANTGDNERLGNGKIDNGEMYVQNVKVEVYNLDGTIAKLYNSETKQLDRNAVTYTEANGKYKIDGIVTGEYYLKFTYGDDTSKLEHDATTIDGGTTKVNARNYKSTIIKDATIKNILNKDYENFNEEDKKWHITHKEGYSVAVDNMKERLEIEDLYYYNFDNPLNMTAYTKPFKTQIEFEATGESNVNGLGEIAGVTETLDKLDFGIIERPREDLFVQKTITYFKITLANGQVLAEGNPNTTNVNYTKALGFKQTIRNGQEARNALEKQLLIEMDSELIQGAQLEIEYAVSLTNNNELDYDYGTLEDYKAEYENTNKGEFDRYITKNQKAKYYYYGETDGLNEIKSTVEYVDYLTSDIVYKDNVKWEQVDVSNELYGENNKIISEETYNAINKNNYQVFQSASGRSVTISIGDTTELLHMTTEKVLTNKENNVYDNSLEIIKIDGKSARTIQESNNGTQVEKTYKPGNYTPNSNSNATEQDDDIVKVTITPPTGLTGDIITYIIAAGVQLMIVLVGIVYIKKKRLIK